MLSVLISSVVDLVFMSQSDQNKEYNIGICSFSAKHAASRRAKTGCLKIRIMCPSGATCLSANYWFSELSL